MSETTDRYEAHYVPGKGRAVAQQQALDEGGDARVPEDIAAVGLYQIYDRVEQTYVVLPAMWANSNAHLIAFAMNLGAARQRLRKSRPAGGGGEAE